MSTAVVNIKIELETKREAQKVVDELGLSLSAAIKAFLKDLIRTKRINFTTEEPNDHLIAVMKKARENRKKGLGSPILRTGEEAVKWLEDQGL